MSLETTTLKKVFVITRHGDRTPIGELYPALHQWKEDGHLTGEGMHQLYTVGTVLRKRFVEENPFLNASYNPSQIHAQSTQKHRTLMSAQCLLLGLYPTGTGPRRPNDEHALPFQIQPVPIFNENAETDYILHAYKKCPYIKELRLQIRSGDEWKEKENETLEFRKMLTTLLGETELLPLQDISSVYHSIKAERIHNKDKRDIVSEEEFNKIDELKDWALQRKYGSREMGKYGAGMLVQKIINTFKNYSEPTNPNKLRFTYYSAHDGTLLALFSAMNMKHLGVPHYAAFIIFELHLDSNSKPIVLLQFYNNHDPINPAHSQKFTLDEFIDVVKDGTVTLEDYLEKCRDIPNIKRDTCIS